MICNKTNVVDGMISIALEREEVSLVFNNVPARICYACGESFADEDTAATILNEAEKLAVLGQRTVIRDFLKVKIVRAIGDEHKS